MTGWNLPPGCTDRMVDEAFGYSSGRRGVYTVQVKAMITIEVEAGSEEDAVHDALIEAKTRPLDKWELDIEEVEGPPERDPDDERDARADYEFERDR